jgi:tetratricopeptide (TPR) repeat protein
MVLALGLGSGCAHRAGTTAAGPPSEAARRLASEAAAVRAIEFEEDFIDARLVYQSLPPGVPERTALRAKMFDYLLGPLAKLSPQRMRREAIELGNNDDFDRVYESFKEALELVAPSELWAAGGAPLAPNELAQLRQAARLTLELFAPRGHEAAVATALVVLGTLEPQNPEWPQRLDQLLSWLDEGTRLALSGAGPRSMPSSADTLEAVWASWPCPALVERLRGVYVKRQERIASALRRPLGTGNARASALGELLMEGEAIQVTAVNLAALYLRPGRIAAARDAVAAVAGKPGDDAELRKLLGAAASNGRADDYLALARRFLPRDEPFRGTSTDRIDGPVALAVLQAGLAAHPGHLETLVLASRVARVMAPFLALRYLQEAQGSASGEEAAVMSAELLELSFLKLRTRIDPERIEPAQREAEALRSQTAAARKRFGDSPARISDADIDFELARGLVDAGQPDRAERLLQRAHESDPNVEIALQLANLAVKRGEPQRAVAILREAIQRQQATAPAQETVGHVESLSKLARNLGNAHELAGEGEAARNAWKLAVRGWERLMVEHLRRKSLGASAEATVEVARLYYLLGRQQDGINKFNEAIEQNENRDQSYIDALAFLVQRGEVDAALDIYRRALSKPNRAVSEYVKIYASLWVLDLTQRAGREPDASAEAYLRLLATRSVHLRPPRAAAWYLQLARYALGKTTYDELLPKADTAGKRAELYFYEAMRRLASGRNDDAHALWNKVLETKMVSFFEYEMAARYLRSGAPTQAAPELTTSAETI